MDDYVSFRPIKTSEAIIKSDGYQAVPGGLYFTTDTKKIYLTDGEDLLSMGGNSSIHYGVMKCEQPDSDATEFQFTLDDIDGNAGIAEVAKKKIPYVDDLIVNVPDLEEGEYNSSGLYRVTKVEGDVIFTEMLPIAASGGGGGGGGGGGPSASRLIITDLDGSQTKHFLHDATEAKLRFSVKSTLPENNYIVKITYKIGTSIVIEDNEVHEFGNIEFDLLPYLSKLSTSNQTNVDVIVEDSYATRKTFNYYVNVVELSLTSTKKENILTTSTGDYTYWCTPVGGSKLYNRKLVYKFFDEAGGHLAELDQEKKVSASGSEITTILDFSAKSTGIYSMEVTYIGYIDAKGERAVESNSLTYQIVYYDETPLLGVYMPDVTIMQYDTISIDYILASTQDDVNDYIITLTKNGTKVNQVTKFNQLQSWDIYFDQAGIYNLSVEDTWGNRKSFDSIIVSEYEGEMPVIDPSESVLYLSATNRSNNELNKDTWTYNEYTCSFDNFIWGEVNGWKYDEEEKLNALHLSSGAKLTVDNFYPYATNAMKNGQTIELDFKITGTTDFSKPIIHCLSHTGSGEIQVGFQLTGQESTMNTSYFKATGGEIKEGDDNQVYNTAIQGLTAKFVEGERIHLTWVIERDANEYPLIITYLNGVISGMTKYDKTDEMLENKAKDKRARIVVDSTYATVDIYNVRVYDKPLDDKTVLDNYIATLATPDERVKKFHDNNDLLDNDNNISVTSIEAGGYTLSVPYIKITGGDALIKDDNGYKLNATDSTVQLPVAKKDYRLIKKYEFIDQNGNHDNQTIEHAFKGDGYLDKGVVMYGQGTSSMEYPVKNLRFKARGKDAAGKKYKFKVNKDDCPVDLVCLKADFMESSGSHNTGTGNLVHTLMKQNGYLSPAQEQYQENAGYTLVTAIRGYPIALFYRPDENSDYEYIGKYNFNLDKGTHEPFGFYPTPEEWEEDDEGNVIIPDELPENSWGWARPEDTITSVPADKWSEVKWINTIHCYEFLNNASALANFKKEVGDETFEDTFFKKSLDGKDEVFHWFKSYESRYPEGDADDGSDIDIASFYRMASWVNSCDTTEATNNEIENFTIKDKNGNLYTIDSKEYRLAKFTQEFTDYFNLTFTSVYYVLTDILLMIDSRAKNMMLATWDNMHWYPIFYDMDTMLGLNNYGYNKFAYDVEDTDSDIYNGEKSVLWNNFRECFQSEINKVYNQLRKTGLSYENLLKIYNEGQADALNEVAANADARYKYVRPFTEGYIKSETGENEWVEPGSVDYLYAAQGRRSMHRAWWLGNRINYSDSKRLSEAYQADRFIMRLYTPEAQYDVYVPAEVTAETWQANTYYLQELDEQGNTIYVKDTAASFREDVVYYKKDTSNKLAQSIIAVKPNNDFTITPLQKQYISVAYGGTNGDVTTPILAAANTPVMVRASGTYNDTETYIYGGSQLKDLGDLSHQYLGRFFFPDKTTKLESLTLGNKHRDYYNPNLSSLDIGSRAPYLKNLDITNCSGLGRRVLNVSECPNLEKIHAIGSGITGINLPKHGAIKELYLPNTVNNLSIIDQINLTDNGFKMRTDVDATENDYSNLLVIELEKVPGINSYEIMKRAANLQRYRLIDVNWIISDSADIVDNKIGVLERMIGDEPELMPNGAHAALCLTGTINITCDVDNAYDIWARYWQSFPNITFNFTDSNIIDINIKDGNGNVYWNKRGQIGSTFTSEFFDEPALTIPKKNSTASHHFDFIGWESPISTNCTPESPNLAKDKMVEYLNAHNSSTGVIEFIPKFKERIRQFEVIFYDEDGSTILKQALYDYAHILTLPNDIYPYKDSSALDLYEVWAFEGFYDTLGRKLERQAIYSDMVYTAKYVKKSVYDNVLDSRYVDWIFTTADSATLVRKTSEAILKGKITLPLLAHKTIRLNNGLLQNHSKLDNSSVELDSSQITHIFFQKDVDNNEVDIGSFAFCQMYNLEYCELPFKIKNIEQGVFFQDDKIKYIGPREYITSDEFTTLTNAKIILPNTIQHIGNETFAIERKACTAILGSQDGLWPVSNINGISNNAVGDMDTTFDSVTAYVKEEEGAMDNVNTKLSEAFNCEKIAIVFGNEIL